VCAYASVHTRVSVYNWLIQNVPNDAICVHVRRLNANFNVLCTTVGSNV